MDLKKFLKFGLVGGIGAIINSCLLYVFVNFFKIYFVIASIIATEVAIISNFIWNNMFTFKDVKDNSSISERFVKFQTISITTVIGTVAILWLLTSYLGLKYLIVWNLVAIVIMFLLNFVLNSKITWKEKNSKKQKEANGLFYLRNEKNENHEREFFRSNKINKHFILILFLAIMPIIISSSIPGINAEFVSVSGIGYHSGSYKEAVVYLSNSSGADLIDANSNKVVASYNLNNAQDYSGNNVNCQGNLQCKIIDFTSFNSPGTYYIKTNTGTQSQQFQISNDIFSNNINTLLSFFDAEQQQGSSFHKDYHSYPDVPLRAIADGSYIMEAGQASETLILLGRAYNNDPQLFKSTDLNKYVKSYVDYLVSLQGAKIVQSPNGFRTNAQVEPQNAFIFTQTNQSTIKLYSPGNPPQFVKEVPLKYIDPNSNKDFYDFSTNYLKCGIDQPCLNSTYQESRGKIQYDPNDYSVAKGWSYEFGCFIDSDPNKAMFNNDYNPCNIFYDSRSMNDSLSTLVAYLEALPMMYDYYKTDSYSLFDRSVKTYDYVKTNYNPNEPESAGYYGTAGFLLYDYTNDTKYLNDAYNVRAKVSITFISDEPHSNDLYWEEYILHRDDLIKNNLNFNINNQDPRNFYSNKMYGDYKDSGPDSISKNSERVFQFNNNIQFQNSRYILLEAMYSAKAKEYSLSQQQFFNIVRDNQLSFLTGMNAIEQGVNLNSPLKPMSFIAGIGDYPKNQHTRYNINTGYSSATNNKLIGVRGINYQFYNGADYIYFDGISEINGYLFGSTGNGYNNRPQTQLFNPKPFINNKDYIPGWITGPYDINSPQETDTIFNYDDNRNSWTFTESENRIVALGIELFSYMDSDLNNGQAVNRINFLTNNQNISNTGPQNYTVNFYSIPSNADIYINNNYDGKTPLTVNLAPNSYLINIKEDGYNQFLQSITINSNLSINISLTKIAISSSVNESAPINNSNITIPDNINNSTPDASNTQNNSSTINNTTDNGQNNTIPNIIVRSNPNNASIIIDNNPQSNTPSNFTLSPGQHTIILKKKGYKDYTISISSDPTRTISINAILEKISSINVLSSRTNVPMINNSYSLYEYDEGDFEIRTDKNINVTWMIDDQVIGTTPNDIIHQFKFIPDITYTNSSRKILISAINSDSNETLMTWYVTVNNVVYAYFSPASGYDGSSINAMINQNKLNPKSVSAEILNDGAIKQYNLSSNSSGLWSYNINDLGPGINSLKTIEILNSDNKIYDYDFTNQSINFNKMSVSTSEGSSGSRGSSSGGSSSGSHSSQDIQVVYTQFEKDVLNTTETESLKLDVKSNLQILSVKAMVIDPLNRSQNITLSLVAGSKSYGTWAKNFTFTRPGLYTLDQIIVKGVNKDGYFKIHDRAFYITNGSSFGEYKNLTLQYVIFDKSIVNETYNATLTLDAVDSIGITSINGIVEIKTGEEKPNYTQVYFERINGDPKYGTWNAYLMIDKADTTYTLDNVTLYNNKSSRTFNITDRSLYATNDLPHNNTISRNNDNGFGFVTGMFSYVRESGFAPLLLGILAFVVIFMIIKTVYNVREKDGDRNKAAK